MATRFKTSINYCEEPPQGFFFTQKSLTQPNEVLSIREMLIKFVRGEPLHASYGAGDFFEDEFVPDARSLDLTERQEWSERFKAKADDMRKSKVKPSPTQTDVSPTGSQPKPKQQTDSAELVTPSDDDKA